MIKVLFCTLFLTLCISATAQIFNLLKSDEKGSRYYLERTESGNSLCIYNDGTFEYEIVFLDHRPGIVQVTGF
jgi:hypothetical protein